MKRRVVRNVVLGLLVCPTVIAAQQGGDGGVRIGALQGPTEGAEGDALGFGVFVYGHDAPLSFTWDFGDGSNPVTGAGLSGISHEYDRGDSTYVVGVEVRGEGIAETRTLDIRIRNAAPRIDFLEVQPDPRLEEPVRFEARATDAGDDDITWTWNFGDGSPARTGEDLSSVTHRYAESGRYTVSLTVSDGEAESSAEVTVFVGTDLVARTSGAMEKLLEGSSGATAAFAGTPFATTAVPRISVGRTEEFCMIWMGFWDEEARVHVSFLWTPTPERLFQPGTYRISDARGGEEVQADQVHVQFNYLGMPGSYESAREQAASGATEGIDSPMGALGQVMGNFRDMYRMMQSGSGDNWMMYGRSGTMTIRDISEDRIEGVFTTGVQGPSLRRGEELEVGMEGRFIFRPVVDVTGTALTACGGERPFTVERHTPDTNERLVDFRQPDVELKFTRAFRPETVTASTVQVGFLGVDGAFRRIEGELSVDAEARTVRFTPSADLRTMVYYRVRVQGGPGGVLSEGGEELPDDTYEWRFATAPRNVPGATSGN